ncbi:type II toxin-antitoxin system RatA family toxin [Actinomadura atramentaria]|uniref:type II toxin-antitoxin system RatA family toxin n=1 Tax=Actinomadura atramentaria TaxID=1990 RepID=UPI00036B379B|nr:SRPBCC family protein [Actinomadura atramentaria]
MPDIAVDMEIAAPADRVWSTVVDIERYPASMSSVRWVRLLADDGRDRRSRWSITLKGSILEWEETETLDHDARVLAFDQVSGDMEVFTGAWRVDAVDAGRTRVTLTIDFEIGIPLLAEMLNPVAQRSLRQNCEEMLRGIERDSVAVGSA